MTYPPKPNDKHTTRITIALEVDHRADSAYFFCPPYSSKNPPKPASTDIEAGLHGQPISNEFIQQADPDILYVIDRTAVMERRPALDMKSLDNPLLRKTKAWTNGRVIFVDAQTWYLCTVSATCLGRMADEVVQGYKG